MGPDKHMKDAWDEEFKKYLDELIKNIEKNDNIIT